MKRLKTTRSLKAFLFGFGSLGNISGGYVSFRQYMRGNNSSDLANDWRKVGKDIRTAMSKINL